MGDNVPGKQQLTLGVVAVYAVHALLLHRAVCLHFVSVEGRMEKFTKVQPLQRVRESNMATFKMHLVPLCGWSNSVSKENDGELAQ